MSFFGGLVCGLLVAGMILLAYMESKEGDN